LYAESLEQREISRGRLAEMSATKEHPTTHSTAAGSRATAEVAKIDNPFELDVAHNSPL
jgi:hypothetical protein